MSTTESIRSLADEILLESSFSIEAPVTHEGLSFIPIVKRDGSAHEAQYLNASQALSSGVLHIIEAGDSVETVIARNTGSVPILIEESEVLVAQGTQDRMVVASVVMSPGEEMRIPVKCVHAPSGLNRGAGFQSAGAALPSMKAKIRTNKYCSIMTDVEHYCAEDAVSQTEVWAEVEKCCKSLGIEDPTEYTEALKRIEERTRDISAKVRNDLPKDTCGVVVIDSNGTVIALELYRAGRAFWERAGFLESLIMEHAVSGRPAIAKEASWSAALQLLLDLRTITEEQALGREGSKNIVIAMDELKGEAITDNSTEGAAKVLYCSLGR